MRIVACLFPKVAPVAPLAMTPKKCRWHTEQEIKGQKGGVVQYVHGNSIGGFDGIVAAPRAGEVSATSD